MISTYLKQAWGMMRQNRLFSSIYILGTGLSIALAMTLFIIFYVKTAPVYPEGNRDRMVVFKYLKVAPPDAPDNWHAGYLSPAAGPILDSLPHVQDMAAVAANLPMHYTVAVSGSRQAFAVSPLYVSPGFWRVFTLRFTGGQAWTERDDRARSHVCVISETLSRRLFATVEAEGRTLLYKGHPYTVRGVVRDVSSATPAAVADVWFPLSLQDQSEVGSDRSALLGGLIYYLTSATPAGRDSVRQEVRDAFRRYDAGRDYITDLMGQPDDAALSAYRTESTSRPDIAGLFRTLAYIVLALLFIPALNMSGMIASRMDRRATELGIRKAYGATRVTLLGQILWENLLLTLLGALAGLAIAWVIALTSDSWILTLFDAKVDTALPAPFLSAEMLFNPWVFLCAFLLCLILNLASALLPAWWGLRHTIVQELYTKR